MHETSLGDPQASIVAVKPSDPTAAAGSALLPNGLGGSKYYHSASADNAAPSSLGGALSAS